MGVAARPSETRGGNGQWLLYRFDPRRAAAGENPLQLDSQAAENQTAGLFALGKSFQMLTKSKPEEAKKLFAQAQVDADHRWKFYQFLAERDTKAGTGQPASPRPRPRRTKQP